MHKPLLIAHRGDTVNFSGNTIEAFQSAFDHGADGIEMDVQMTDDGELIVVHDYMYDTSRKYPRLEDVIEKFAHKGRLEIELKSLDINIISKVAEIIHKYNPFDYEITSSVLPLLSHVRKSLPDAKVGMIFRSNLIEKWMSKDFILTFLEGYLQLTNSNVLHLDIDKYTPEIVSYLHSKNYLLHALIRIQDNDKFKYIQDLGLDQCTFDDINLLNRR